MVLLNICGNTVLATRKSINFQHLWVEDGLSQSTVFSIYKDQKEFIWFGTRRGLNMYDGYMFKHFQHEINNPGSISSNIIFEVIGDKKDNLIIQTDNSIDYFDRYNDNFSVILSVNTQWSFARDWDNNIWACSGTGLFFFDETSITFNPVANEKPFVDLYDLAMDKENNIWIAGKEGVIKYNTEDQSFEVFKILSNDKISESFFIEIDSENRTWICLSNGQLFYFDKNEQCFVEYNITTNLENLIVTSFNKGLDSTILIGTDGNGLIILDIKTEKIYDYNHVPDKKGSLSSNTIYSIYADNKNGILWLGSYMGGVDYYSRYNKGLYFVYHEPYNKNSIINSNIRSITIDSHNQIWLGTRQGISTLDTLNNLVQQFDQQTLLKAGIRNPIITKIWQDSDHYIWIFSYKGGGVLYDLVHEKLVPVEEVYPRIKLPKNLGVFDILLDSHDNYWFATDEGTYLFPHGKEGFVFHEDFSKRIIEDRAGRIFIGTSYAGLLQVNVQSLQFQPVTFDSLRNSSSIKRINTIFEDRSGNIWVGTGGTGLVKYNPASNTTIHYTVLEGLSDDNISGIIQDNSKDLWITTYSGLCRYSAITNKFKHVFLKGGIKGKEFNPNSIVKTNSGIVYAGSVNGLLVFNANTYRENPYLPDVVFTNLYINNEKVEIGQKDAPINRTIMFSDKVELKYFQNSITLDFTAPTYYLGDKVRFYYSFGEENEPWKDIGNNRSLNFVDLKPGDYTLRIKAENSDGHSKTRPGSLKIHVDPPLWRTNMAYFLYLLVLTGIILLVRKITKSKMNLEYQVLLQKAEKEKQEELNQARVKLFTDVSHEIGTSLTLINVPLEILTKIEDEELKKHQLAIIKKNVTRLIHLAKRIIGLRKIETGNMPLMAEKDDIVSFVKSICINYESIARQKKIKLIIDLPYEELQTWFDKEKVEYILYNLLSNALKFEPENGKVTISLTKENKAIKEKKRKVISIKVNNEGSVISKDKARDIFQRFYTGNESTYSSGIGLSLAKSYVDIHKGEILLNSNEQTGVTFEVLLPFGEAYLETKEKIISGTEYEMRTPFYIEPEEEYNYAGDKEETDTNNRIKILLVEDNIDMRKLLKEQLMKNYTIIVARDGEEGFLKAKNLLPDLIITDLIMPNMDGIELCKRVKNDIEIEHIPVIILTAKEDMEEQSRSMEAGADHYITKPFQLNYLDAVISNLIRTREKLKKKYYSIAGISDEPIDIKSMDENFLEKAHRVLEDNLSNLQFGIPEFTDQLGVSKYMLYSKIKNLSGQTPNDFIISYRLKKAVHILRSKNIKDRDLYYQVGFNDVSYFRKCFKRHFGMTPNQFVRSEKFNANQ